MNWLSFVKWKMITAVFTLGVASSGCVAVSFAAKPICEYSVLDESAGVNFVAGLPVYVSPRKVTKFSGCQTMWDSKGRISMQIFFREGKAVRYIEHKDGGAEELICDYTKGVVASKACPGLQDLEKGFMVFSDEMEKSLPTFDDLRRRDSMRK